MGVHRVAHVARENQVLLGHVIHRKLDAHHNGSSLGSEGHPLKNKRVGLSAVYSDSTFTSD